MSSRQASSFCLLAGVFRSGVECELQTRLQYSRCSTPPKDIKNVPQQVNKAKISRYTYHSCWTSIVNTVYLPPRALSYPHWCYLPHTEYVWHHQPYCAPHHSLFSCSSREAADAPQRQTTSPSAQCNQQQAVEQNAGNIKAKHAEFDMQKKCR